MTNKNLEFLREQVPQSRIVTLQGGTRSGKTYSTLQYIIEICCEYRGMVITIARKTFPALKGSVMRDFFEILRKEKMYSPNNHNKTDHTYMLNGNLVEFISLDDELKVRGRKRQMAFINEVNECDLDTWRQLMLRTSTVCIADYNPSDAEHWYYDEVLPREDCKVLVTTYKDNPFLAEGQIAEIERYKELDPDYWRVFGEGQRGLSRRGQIFTHFQKVKAMPSGRYFYGLDFGQTNDPTALVRCLYDGSLFLEQVVYQTNLTSSEMTKLFKAEGITKEPIYADSASPLMIRELKQSGFNIVGAEKGSGSILAGIDKLKSLEVFVTEDSRDYWKEVQWHSWKLGKDGKPTNTPLDLHNHLIDATRYAISKEVMRPRPKGLKVM